MAQAPQNGKDPPLTAPSAEASKWAAETVKSAPKGFFDNIWDFVNGPLLRGAETTVDTASVPPGKHRLACATMLTAGLFAGHYVMKVLTGMTTKGEAFSLANTPTLLRPLHGALKYDYWSVEPKHEWMKILHYAVPAVASGVGTWLGSNFIFRGKRHELQRPETLVDFDRLASSEQAKPWGIWSAISSIWSATSGFNLLPVPMNYGLTLGEKFTLDSDRATSVPFWNGFGEWWSNNHSRFPLQPAPLLKLMASYLANNPDQNPQQLEEMTKGVLAHWYDSVTPAQIHSFSNDMMALRDQLRAEGKAPQEVKKQLLETVHGTGMWDLLEAAGLSPEEAKLGNNGISGKMANTLGAKAHVEKLEKAHREAYREYKKTKLAAAAKDPGGHFERPLSQEDLAAMQPFKATDPNHSPKETVKTILSAKAPAQSFTARLNAEPELQTGLSPV